MLHATPPSSKNRYLDLRVVIPPTDAMPAATCHHPGTCDGDLAPALQHDTRHVIGRHPRLYLNPNNTQHHNQSLPIAHSLFSPAQAHPASLLAPSASAATPILLPNASRTPSGMVLGLIANNQNRVVWSTRTGIPYARTGRDQEAAPPRDTTRATSAPDAGNRLTALNNVLMHRRHKAHTPLKAREWHRLLLTTHLLKKYPTLPHNIQFGFDAGIRPITETFAPPNNPSIATLAASFTEIVEKEFNRGRYIGPLSRAETEHILGPFQSSPLSLTPKPDKPDKYRLVQNFSFPHSPTSTISSINHTINSDLYPCTWGTFSTICLLIWRLPPGSEAAVGDVAEAYRTIPVTPTQWPGLVVRLPGQDKFAVDTCNCFGLATSAGSYGIVADAGTDITRALWIGPVSKWVDDHIFFRILRQHLQEYNNQRRKWSTTIRTNGGRLHDGGRIWY